jgi:hypothetical protein
MENELRMDEELKSDSARSQYRSESDPSCLVTISYKAQSKRGTPTSATHSAASGFRHPRRLASPAGAIGRLRPQATSRTRWASARARSFFNP